MKITDIIAKKAILVALKSKDKRGAVTELVQAMRRTDEGEKIVVADIVDAVMQREKIGSTGLGGGVAVPHAKINGVKELIGAFGRSAHGLEYEAVDGGAVHLIFLILSPPAQDEAYHKALQKIMLAIRRPNVLKFLRSAKGAREIEEIFKEAEESASVPSGDGR